MACNVVIGWVENLSLLVAGWPRASRSPSARWPRLRRRRRAAGVRDVPGPAPAPSSVRHGDRRPTEDTAATESTAQLLRHDRPARLLVGLIGAEFLVVGALDLLFVVMAVDVLDAGAAWAGYLNTAYGAGALVFGALAALLIGRRLGPVVLAHRSGARTRSCSRDDLRAGGRHGAARRRGRSARAARRQCAGAPPADRSPAPAGRGLRGRRGTAHDRPGSRIPARAAPDVARRRDPGNARHGGDPARAGAGSGCPLLMRVDQHARVPVVEISCSASCRSSRSSRPLARGRWRSDSSASSSSPARRSCAKARSGSTTTRSRTATSQCCGEDAPSPGSVAPTGWARSP